MSSSEMQQRDQPNPPPSWQWKSTVLSSREGQQEQFMQENQGLGSASVTTAQFLQGRRMIQSGGVTPAYGSREHQGTVSIVVSTRTRLDRGQRQPPPWMEKYEFAGEAAARARAGDRWRSRCSLRLRPASLNDASFRLHKTVHQGPSWGVAAVGRLCLRQPLLH